MVSPAPCMTRLTLAAARPFLRAIRPAAAMMRSWVRRFLTVCRDVFAIAGRCYYIGRALAALFRRLRSALDVLVVGLDPVFLDRVLRVLQLQRVVADQLMEPEIELFLLLGPHLLVRRQRPEVVWIVAAAERDRDQVIEVAGEVLGALAVAFERLITLPLGDRLDRRFEV